MKTGKSSGCKFTQTLTNQGPTYDNARKRKKRMVKHSGNKRRDGKYL